MSIVQIYSAHKMKNFIYIKSEEQEFCRERKVGDTAGGEKYGKWKTGNEESEIKSETSE